jgi:hypothetical protein
MLNILNFHFLRGGKENEKGIDKMGQITRILFITG